MKGGAGVAKGEGEPIARAHVLLKAIVRRAFDKGTQSVPAHLPPPLLSWRPHVRYVLCQADRLSFEPVGEGGDSELQTIPHHHHSPGGAVARHPLGKLKKDEGTVGRLLEHARERGKI